MEYLIANLKTSMNLNAVAEYLDKVQKGIDNSKKVIYAPSSLYLEKFQNAGLEVAAQNIFAHEGPNFTGAITIEQYKNMDVKYCILGHSEVRRFFNESDDIIFQKIKLALRYNIKVILCVGEDAEQRRMKHTLKVISNQLKKITTLDKELLDDIIIAYEPIWAIGSGIIPTNKDIVEVLEFIENIFKSHKPKILYGGSVNRNNVNNLMGIKKLNGFLVGTASFDADHFIEIANAIWDEKSN